MKNIRNLENVDVLDPSIIDNLMYNNAAGSRKSTQVGGHLLPIPYIFSGAVAYTTDISSTVGVQTIQPVADVAGSLAGTYFLLQSQSGNKYAMWFKVSGSGSAPVVPGYTASEVDIATGNSAAVVGGALAAAIAALNSGNDFTTSGTTTITVTNKTAGSFTLASDVSTGFTFALVTAGSGGPLALPKKGANLAVYNKDTSVHSITLGEDNTTVPLAAGVTDSNGHVGIPCAAGEWTYLSCATQNWVITDSNKLLVFIIDDSTYIRQSVR